MVVVMAIVGLLAVLALPRGPGATSRSEAEQVALHMASLLKADRYAAMRSHATVTTVFDLDAREIRSGATSRRYVAPGDLDLLANASSHCRVSGRRVGIVFLADGRSCDARIVLGRLGAGFAVRVNGITGGVSVEQA
jgi:general secretion pathway protein H